MSDKPDRYSELRRVLDMAYRQAQSGKGHERHDHGEGFQDQQICQLGRWMGTADFNIGQACKKSLESKVVGPERGIAELLGAINYLAAAVILLEEAQREERLGEEQQQKELAVDVPIGSVWRVKSDAFCGGEEWRVVGLGSFGSYLCKCLKVGTREKEFEVGAVTSWALPDDDLFERIS